MEIVNSSHGVRVSTQNLAIRVQISVGLFFELYILNEVRKIILLNWRLQ